MTRPFQILRGHLITFIAVAAAVATYPFTDILVRLPARAILAWDAFSVVFLVLAVVMMVRATPPDMPLQARAQEDGEWSIFTVVVLGVAISFLALVAEFPGVKDKDPAMRDLTVALVVATLLLSWLVMQVVFRAALCPRILHGDRGHGRSTRGCNSRTRNCRTTGTSSTSPSCSA